MDISGIKEKLLKAVDSIDMNKLSLMEIRQITDIVKTLSSIEDTTYLNAMNKLIEGMNRSAISAPPTVEDLKVEGENHDGM